MLLGFSNRTVLPGSARVQDEIITLVDGRVLCDWIDIDGRTVTGA